MNKKFWGSLFKGGLNLLNNAVNGRNRLNLKGNGLIRGRLGLKYDPNGKKIRWLIKKIKFLFLYIKKKIIIDNLI